MAAKIRLKRIGKIRTPHYRIVVMDARQKRDGKAIEEIGLYHPKNDPSVIKVNSERAQYWLGVGAQPTEAVIALFKRTGDWQTFTGDSSPSGVDVAPEKADKLELFNAALAEIDSAPKTDAIAKKGDKKAKAADKAADKADEAKADEAKVEAPAEDAADEKADA